MTDTSKPMTPSALTPVAEVSGAHGTHLALARDGHRWALADHLAIQLGHDAVVDRRVTAPAPIQHLAWSGDDRRLLACPHVYDPAQGAWARVPGLGKALVGGLEDPPPPDQIGIAAGSFAPDGAELVVVTRFQPSRELGAVDTYRGPHERLLLLGAQGALRAVLDAGDDELRAVAVSDRHVAAGGATVRLWERGSHRQSATLAHHRLTARALAFDPAGTRLAIVAADGAASSWDTSTGKLLASWQAHQGDAYAAAMHPRAPLVATGGQDGKLRLWSTAGQLVAEASLGGWVQAVAFDATGERLGAVARSTPPRLVIFTVRAPAQP